MPDKNEKVYTQSQVDHLTGAHALTTSLISVTALVCGILAGYAMRAGWKTLAECPAWWDLAALGVVGLMAAIPKIRSLV